MLISYSTLYKEGGEADNLINQWLLFPGLAIEYYALSRLWKEKGSQSLISFSSRV